MAFTKSIYDNQRPTYTGGFSFGMNDDRRNAQDAFSQEQAGYFGGGMSANQYADLAYKDYLRSKELELADISNRRADALSERDWERSNSRAELDWGRRLQSEKSQFDRALQLQQMKQKPLEQLVSSYSASQAPGASRLSEILNAYKSIFGGQNADESLKSNYRTISDLLRG